MKYILDKDNKCIAKIDYNPNLKDLESRNETLLETDLEIPIGDIYTNGVITKPESIQPIPLTREEILESIRRTRDNILNTTSYIFQRQSTGTESQKLSPEDYSKWVTYWQQLRDFPDTCDVNNIIWPENLLFHKYIQTTLLRVVCI